jgi:lipopolysaccharide export system protein LptA
MKYNACYHYLFFILANIGLAPSLWAQKDTSKNSVHVIHSEFLRFERFDGREIQYLSQDIAVLHKKTYLFCDSAVIEGQRVLAIGHVRIVEGDSLQIFGDTLYYDGQKLQADFINNIVLRHKDRQLFTSALHYDLKKRIASYTTGGLLSSGNTHLESNRGYYHAKQEMAFFKDSVNVILQDSMNLQADSMIFDAKKNHVVFTGPTDIKQKDMNIFAEAGYYDINLQRSFFWKNPVYRKSSQSADAENIEFRAQENVIILNRNAWIRDSVQQAKGDSIYIDQAKDMVYIYGNGWYKDKDRSLKGESIIYNKKTKSLQVQGRTQVFEGKQIITADKIVYSGDKDLGEAFGEVILRDTQSGFEIHCDTFQYNKKDKLLIPIGKRKYISTPVDNDTLYMTADSLLSKQISENGDTFNIMRAFYHVKIWSNKMQGLCDSLYFDGRDSVFRMMYNPVLWADTTQFIGDTILLYLKNKALNQIHLIQKAFVLTESVTNLTNQMKGRYITAFFANKRMDHLTAQGNAESVYFIQDEDKAYIGTNYIKSSSMKMVFNDQRKIDKIHFYTKPEGNMLPLHSGKTKLLEGYISRSKEKPTSLEDIIK